MVKADARMEQWIETVNKRLAKLENKDDLGDARLSTDKTDRLRLVRGLQTSTNRMDTCQISETVGKPFDVEYYVHWKQPGESWDGGYKEFDTMEKARDFVEIQQLEFPDYLYAIVAKLDCTVELIGVKGSGTIPPRKSA